MAILFKGLAATFRTLGNAATTHNIFTIENANGSNVIVKIKRLVVQMDATGALAVVMPLVKTSRCALPTGGTSLAKGKFQTGQSSSAYITLRGATNADGAAATAITATPGDIMWQQYCMRLHTAVGQVLGLDNPLLPTLIENDPVELLANEALLVQVVAAAGTSNPATNNWFVQCVWEEEG